MPNCINWPCAKESGHAGPCSTMAFQCGTGEMGMLWWPKDSNLDVLPDTKPATEEQLRNLEIEYDSEGHIVAVKPLRK